MPASFIPAERSDSIKSHHTSLFCRLTDFCWFVLLNSGPLFGLTSSRRWGFFSHREVSCICSEPELCVFCALHSTHRAIIAFPWQATEWATFHHQLPSKTRAVAICGCLTHVVFPFSQTRRYSQLRKFCESVWFMVTTKATPWLRIRHKNMNM